MSSAMRRMLTPQRLAALQRLYTAGSAVRRIPTRSTSDAIATWARPFSSSALPEVSEDPHRELLRLANESEVSEHMFCFQCEQALNNTGCNRKRGVCGKTEDVAALQDLLIYSLKGLSSYAHHARLKTGYHDAGVNEFITGATFSTLTNVNFDADRFHDMLVQADAFKAEIQAHLEAKGHNAALGSDDDVMAVPSGTASGDWLATHPAHFHLPSDPSTDDMVKLGHQVGVTARRTALGNDTLLGVQEMLVYGLKGMAAYYHHARQLGQNDPAVDAFIQDTFSFLSGKAANDAGAVLDYCMKLGEVNGSVMKMLSDGHTGRYGHMVPTEVRCTPVAGKCILVSGHDMRDLEALLEQTKGTGVNVYTHGEMLPGHAYPGLKKYEHLVGHFGGGWMNQKTEFPHFPGPIVVTTNCLQEPKPSYRERIYTMNETGWSGVQHIESRDFSKAISQAQGMDGYSSSVVSMMGDPEHVTTGYGHDFVLSVAGKVLEAVEVGDLKRIFVVGGCDGHEMDRKYYTDLVASLPRETMVLTMGCAKFRFNKQELGTLEKTGLPRLLDMGQCNDSYSALVVANALADALGCGVNDLPLTLNISWFEQKAVAVLLTLLQQGVTNIRLGPQLPAFLTPDAINLLVEKFDIKPAMTHDTATDLKLMMDGK